MTNVKKTKFFQKPLEIYRVLVRKTMLSSVSVQTAIRISDAASCGNIELLQRALYKSKRATLNHAIHIACSGGWVDMVKWLLENGANPNIPDNKGKTPLYWIIAGDGWAVGDENRLNEPSKYREIYYLMLKHGMKYDKNQINKAKEEKNSNYEYIFA